jgi:2-polyprenyl-3-methyl-5-hydroxy-6-metoxy-1,4-benzoquinol methylase
MSATTSTYASSASRAFDALAFNYDEVFTRSLIGMAQRNPVWKRILQTFRPGQAVLELNCGTGEDALFMARHGISVSAFDASEQMIRVAERRKSCESLSPTVNLQVLAIEDLDRLSLELGDRSHLFDGAFSNFSGLNCVEDLQRVARHLSQLLRPKSSALLCFSNRTCAWEMLWYLLRADWERAFRRMRRDGTTAFIAGNPVRVRYPSVREISESFSPHFRLKLVEGIGILVPPSYVERCAKKQPALIRMFSRLDDRIRRLAGFRTMGDHVLMVFEKVDG